MRTTSSASPSAIGLPTGSMRSHRTNGGGAVAIPTFATFDVDFLVEYMVHREAHHVYQMFMRRIKVAAP
jgi:hypothetical protein